MFGLASRPDLNGQGGVAVDFAWHFDESKSNEDRYTVDLDSGSTFRIKPHNLRQERPADRKHAAAPGGKGDGGKKGKKGKRGKKGKGKKGNAQSGALRPEPAATVVPAQLAVDELIEMSPSPSPTNLADHR